MTTTNTDWSDRPSPTLSITSCFLWVEISTVVHSHWSRKSKYCALIGGTLLCWHQGLCYNNTAQGKMPLVAPWAVSVWHKRELRAGVSNILISDLCSSPLRISPSFKDPGAVSDPCEEKPEVSSHCPFGMPIMCFTIKLWTFDNGVCREYARPQRSYKGKGNSFDTKKECESRCLSKIIPLANDQVIFVILTAHYHLEFDILSGKRWGDEYSDEEDNDKVDITRDKGVREKGEL